MATKASPRGNPRTRTGVVVGDKMDKTVVVEIHSTVLHCRFKKYVRRKKCFKAHDQNNTCHLGDRVEIVESRPLSKTKCWRVRRVLGGATS